MDKATFTATFTGNWNQVSGKVKQQWGRLTDADLTKINGRYDELLEIIQEKYGVSKQQAETEVSKFYETYRSH